ncbi:phage tail spike protein [Paraclostridium dentum]|uniref:phage tail spike protein n=1 Tax=Paraclostridium dentum TaxID=2662455 RepID=UPI00147318C9|nr:phage tail spike protein [Paraclostridium dentum]
MQLYKKDGITLIGNIEKILSCEAEEERNGLFEAVLDCPLNNPLFNDFVEENIIVCKPNDIQDNQAFRIYNTTKFMNNVKTVYARHISFDLAYDFLDTLILTNSSCENALNEIFRQSQFSKHYRGYSDIIQAQNYSMELANCLEAIAGKEGSIIDTFGNGAEILRDNTNFHVLNKRGHDNSVTIEYSKNLTGFELNTDFQGLITKIKPYAKYKNEDNEEVVIKGDFINSPNHDSFSHSYIRAIDYSDKFSNDEVPTVAKLNYLAEQEYLVNKVHIPKANYKIEFIPLSRCIGYSDIEDRISICDTVTVIDSRYGIDTKAKVIKYKYDVINQMYLSMELGEPRTTLGDIITSNDGKDGENGKDGQDGAQGPPGKDGDIENMPDTLPAIPTLTGKVFGMGTIELSWTFDSALYYDYELYASKTKDFTPNTFDLIHAGKSSSFAYKVMACDTWYFKVCAKNSHNRRTPFSNQVAITVKKEEDMSNYFSDIAIGKAVVQSLSADYMEAGIIKAHWVELKGASVIDGNGKRTFDIDSFGRITLMPSVFKMMIDGKEEGVVTESKLLATKNELSHTITEIGSPNIVSNSDFEADGHNWFIHAGATIDYNANSYLGNQYGKMVGITSNYGGGLFQKIKTMPGEKYTVSFYALAQNLQPLVTNIGIEGINVISLENEPGFKRWTFEFVATKETHTFVAYAIHPGTFFIGRIMINKGPLREYSSRQDEIYSKTVRLDGTGVNIESPNCRTKTNIDTNGMEVTDTKDNTSILSAKDGDVVAKGGHFKVTHPQNGEIVLWGRDVVINNGRALVGTGNVSEIGANKLYINYLNDFFNGVHIGGSVAISENLQVNNHDVITSKGFASTPFGFHIFSTGLILQWGTFSGFGDGDTTVYYATEFPNECVHFNPVFEGDRDTMFDVHAYDVNRINAKVITKFMYGFNDRSRMIKWYAIGY